MTFDIKHPVLLVAFMTVFALGWGLVRMRPWTVDAAQPQGYHLSMIEAVIDMPAPISKYRPFPKTKVFARIDDGRLGDWIYTPETSAAVGDIVCVHVIKWPRTDVLELRPVPVRRCVPEPEPLPAGHWIGPAREVRPPTD